MDRVRAGARLFYNYFVDKEGTGYRHTASLLSVSLRTNE